MPITRCQCASADIPSRRRALTPRAAALGAACLYLTAVTPVLAGVTNPDISVIGQPSISLTDDRGPDGTGTSGRNRPRLDAGETEVMIDSYLNPYARGTFVFAFAEDEAGVEEAYFQLLRGLPGGFALKGGKYRVGFGRLNPMHPHAYPFAERFHLLEAYLPGEEAFNETGLSLSGRIPVGGDFSLVAAVDWLQGDTFRSAGEGEEGAGWHPALCGRLAGFAMLGERSGIEFGLSGARGTHDPAADRQTTILGADFKAKLWCSPLSNLVLQGEVMRRSRQDTDAVESFGGYLYADYSLDTRYDLGASYERFQQSTPDRDWESAVGLFAGLSLMEETTSFRLGWERHQLPEADGSNPGSLAAANTVTLRALYSLGPHKAHQF
ncbi:MAG: hypothetical protein WDA75_02300 [Candidatus Latescibacterota bacterium]|jgi:hypothetical protein